MPRPTGQEAWNFLTFYSVSSCETTLYVYFETLFEATENLIMFLLVFGPFDLLRSIFRPARLGTGTHRRRGRKGNPKSPVIPEVNDLIWEHIPGHEVINARKVTSGVKQMWRIDNAGQELLYYLMIADAVQGFWMDMYSSIIKHETSNCPDIVRMVRTGSFPFSAPVFWLARPLNVDKVTQNCISTALQCQLPAGTFNVCLTCSVRNVDPFARASEVQLRLLYNNGVFDDYQYSPRKIVAPGEEKTLMAQFVVRNPFVIAWEFGNLPINDTHGELVFDDVECFIYQMAAA